MLLFRQRYTQNVSAIILRQCQAHSAPATSDIQHPHHAGGDAIGFAPGVEFVDTLPRLDNGKVYKRWLRDRYRASAAKSAGDATSKSTPS